MKIPHKSMQKEGWLYWDFHYNLPLIEFFVKDKRITSFTEMLYRSLFGNIDIKTEVVLGNHHDHTLNEVKLAIEKELYLIGHFPLFHWEKTLKLQIPPPWDVRFPIKNNIEFTKIEEHEGSLPLIYDTLHYRLKKATMTDAYYELMSKVKIEVG